MSQATLPGSMAMGIMDVKRRQAHSPSVPSLASCKNIRINASIVSKGF